MTSSPNFDRCALFIVKNGKMLLHDNQQGVIFSCRLFTLAS